MLQTIDHQGIVEIRLDRPPANALNTALVRALLEALRTATAQGCAGLVLSGREGMFSGGLDVPELLPLPRPEIDEFWQLFFALTRRLAGSPVPVAAAITGHCPAGGAVLAVHCDFRVAAAGPFRIGFNEVRVGLPVPSTILAVLTELVGVRQARRLAVEGLLVDMDEALALGFVDELQPAADVVPRAVAWCRALAELPPVAMGATRELARADMLARLAAADDAAVAAEYWFSAETQAAMAALVARLRDR